MIKFRKIVICLYFRLLQNVSRETGKGGRGEKHEGTKGGKHKEEKEK